MAAEDRLITYRWGEEDHEEGGGEAWASEDFLGQGKDGWSYLGGGQLHSALGDGLEVSRSGLLRSGTGDHGLRGVGHSFIWQEGNHRLQASGVIMDYRLQVTGLKEVN